MIVVHVEHFLDSAGQAYFPIWLAEAASVLGGFEGFVNIRPLTDIHNEQGCHLLLQFESLPLLRHWSASDAHEELINLLAPYRHKIQQSMIFEAGAPLGDSPPS